MSYVLLLKFNKYAMENLFTKSIIYEKSLSCQPLNIGTIGTIGNIGTYFEMNHEYLGLSK